MGLEDCRLELLFLFIPETFTILWWQSGGGGNLIGIYCLCILFLSLNKERRITSVFVFILGGTTKLTYLLTYPAIIRGRRIIKSSSTSKPQDNGLTRFFLLDVKSGSSRLLLLLLLTTFSQSTSHMWHISVKRKLKLPSHAHTEGVPDACHGP